MAYKQFNKGGFDQVKSLEQIAAEEFHQDMAAYRNIAFLIDFKLFIGYTIILTKKWHRLYKDTPYDQEIKDIIKDAQIKKNGFIMAVKLIDILNLSATEAGYFGRVNIATENPYNETKETKTA
jgi:hypothetical protein